MSFDLVLFGGTGDLTWRKLMPALFQAHRHGKLPKGGRILAVARDERSDDEYRAFIKERFGDVDASKRPSDDEFAGFAQMLHYRRMDLSQPEHYAGLKRWLYEPAGAEGRAGAPADTVVLFLATSPHLFPAICQQLGNAGLNGPNVRVVLEKPLGHDLASAQEINRVVSSAFKEEQALRIDHYLGKPAVQNLMALRFGNALFEPLWRRESIANIQITLAESIGVGTRGDFYDRTGALRDMIQNHALQLLTMIAMEPPPTSDADAIRDEKLKVLRSLRPFTPELVARDVVRGQYTAGEVAGEQRPAYRHEKKVAPDSTVETYVAMRLFIDNWRWSTVPFYLRTGKNLPLSASEVRVQFRSPPSVLYTAQANQKLDANAITLRLQPDEGISLRFNGKVPGTSMKLRPVRMHFSYDSEFGAYTPEAYERLLLEAIAADATLFIRRDEVETAWRIVDPIHSAWDDKALSGKEFYPAGTWGPVAADELLAQLGHAWRHPAPIK